MNDLPTDQDLSLAEDDRPRSRRGWLLGMLAFAIFLIWGVQRVDVRRLMPSAEGAEEVPTVDWELLELLNTNTGAAPPELTAFDGQEVKILGYVLPLEDIGGEIREFLLVPFVGACVHVPPPPPNQMIYVRMEPGHQIEVDAWSWDPIWMVGRLELASWRSPWGEIGYQMAGLSAEVLDWGEML